MRATLAIGRVAHGLGHLIAPYGSADAPLNLPPPQASLNDIGIVEFEATRNLSFDLYSQNRHSGSFILIDPLTKATVGAGMITERNWDG